jgi:cardiolipin synthase (CMP-forming)
MGPQFCGLIFLAGKMPAVINAGRRPAFIMKLTTATILTLLRMFLIPFLAMAILYSRYGLALLIFLISGLSDLLDGFIARKFQQKTRLGALLDPMADKLLLSSSFLLMTLPGNLAVAIPLWLAVMVFSRDIFIVVGAVAVALTMGFTKFDPTIYGKASTFVQIVCVLTVLVANYLRWNPEWIQWLFYVTFALTLFSGIHYIYTFTKRYEKFESDEKK